MLGASIGLVLVRDVLLCVVCRHGRDPPPCAIRGWRSCGPTITPECWGCWRKHRDVARMKNKVAYRLHALLMELTAGGLASEMTVNKAQSLLEQLDISDEMTRQRVMIATELLDDMARLDSQMRGSKKQIRAAVAASGTTLCDIGGIGPIGAAIILGSVGDITRFPTAGHFASYNATAPIEASSGDKRRHPLNPRGNRKLNHVLHIAAPNSALLINSRHRLLRLAVTQRSRVNIFLDRNILRT